MKLMISVFIFSFIILSSGIIFVLVEKLQFELIDSLLSLPVVLLVLCAIIYFRRKLIFARLDINDHYVAFVYKKEIIKRIKYEDLETVVINNNKGKYGFIVFSQKIVKNELNNNLIYNHYNLQMLSHKNLLTYIENIKYKLPVTINYK